MDNITFKIQNLGVGIKLHLKPRIIFLHTIIF